MRQKHSRLILSDIRMLEAGWVASDHRQFMRFSGRIRHMHAQVEVQKQIRSQPSRTEPDLNA